jgi:drug/metabolite transporter (DMT)-like permease
MLHHRPREPTDDALGVHGSEVLQPIPPEASARGHAPPDRVDPPARLGWLVFWMSGTLGAFIIAALSVRALAHSLNAFEMMTVRSAGGLIILLVMGLASPALLRSIRARHMRMQFTRNFVHFGSQICWTLAITLLPLATVFALEFQIPAWVTLLAVLFLGERMTATRAGALVICFVGVLVILRPGLEAFQPAALLLVLGSLLFAIAAVITKKLIVTETTFSIMFWMNLMQLPMNFAGSDLSSFLRLDAAMALPLLGVAAAGLAIHYCLTNAFRYGDAMIVIPMDFLRVPLVAIIGWMFYGEHLDIFVFAGASLIVGGVLWNVRGEAQRNGRLAAARGPAIQPAE